MLQSLEKNYTRQQYTENSFSTFSKYLVELIHKQNLILFCFCCVLAKERETGNSSYLERKQSNSACIAESMRYQSGVRERRTPDKERFYHDNHAASRTTSLLRAIVRRCAGTHQYDHQSDGHTRGDTLPATGRAFPLHLHPPDGSLAFICPRPVCRSP